VNFDITGVGQWGTINGVNTYSATVLTAHITLFSGTGTTPSPVAPTVAGQFATGFTPGIALGQTTLIDPSGSNSASASFKNGVLTGLSFDLTVDYNDASGTFSPTVFTIESVATPTTGRGGESKILSTGSGNTLIQLGVDPIGAASELTFTPVPEPATLALFGIASLGLAGLRRWKANKDRA
jgi:hypothetical protein